MDLKSKINQYRLLKRQEKLLRERLAGLNNEIKKELQDEQILFGIKKQVKDHTKLDPVSSEDILRKKNLWHEGTKLVIDPDAIEALYWLGKLTDGDLREMRAPDSRYALVEVKECTNQDSVCG